jgi:AcrR family transcriptional regulator
MKRPYHHGDLPAALLQAAEAILREQGLPALTLRAVARRAGVSHTAAAPHFGDLTGLMTELAASGFRRFNAALGQAQANPGARTPNRATAHAYVRFAVENPALFLLMFRPERLDYERPSLREAAQGAQAALMRTTGSPASTAPPDLATLGVATANWSLVHGFALLLIDGLLRSLLEAPAANGNAEALLDAALQASSIPLVSPNG